VLTPLIHRHACAREHAGVFDRMVLLRYAHVMRHRTSGGVEQYLDRVNRELLARHRMTIVQMHLAPDDTSGETTREAIGRGTLLRVPVRISTGGRSPRGLATRLRQLATARRETDGTHPRAPHALLHVARGLAYSRGAHLRYRAMVLSEPLIGVLAREGVTLLAFHWLSYDAWRLRTEARRRRIPFVFVNHFDNARFHGPELRRFLGGAAAVGGVSAVGLPDALAGDYRHLSDGIDTAFFQPVARVTDPGTPVVLLPARIAPTKGHTDVIEAASILEARRCRVRQAFAGATESSDLEARLRAQASAAGMADRTGFLGQQTAEQMKRLYAESAVTVLPSYSEGLPRVLLEAQAMEKPVVAYDTGGVREALVNKETGHLLPRGSVERLADTIQALVEHPVEAGVMGRRGRAFVTARFSIEALVARHEAFYRAAAAAAPDDLRPRTS
jgi:glycosyltransferase involved in cell wall biosynthesis